jgi:hypothetical protein
MHIIIMPPHPIIIGIPICIMFIMLSQHFMNISFMDTSMGIISQVMPVAVIVHFIWQPIVIGMPIIGMPVIGIGIMPGIIGFIMPFIIMGIGIICIAAFIFRLQSDRKKQLLCSAYVDKMTCYCRQQWNVQSVSFPLTRRLACDFQRRFRAT